MSSARIYSLPSRTQMRWMITEMEENVPCSFVLTVGVEEPIRSFAFPIDIDSSYVFNPNSLTLRSCKQMGQKASKIVALLFSSPDIYYCSPFAGRNATRV